MVNFSCRLGKTAIRRNRFVLLSFIVLPYSESVLKDFQGSKKPFQVKQGCGLWQVYTTMLQVALALRYLYSL